MMLFKLSFANMKKSMKDYAVYFFTLILGVAIFYIFNAIDSQSAMMEISKDTREIIKLMTSILSSVSVCIAFVLGFLIIYASNFLMKRRNKEFALYFLLGMSKRKVSIILFFETLIIGIISLIVGLVIGVCLSQLSSVFVANMFEADMTKFSFVFSKSACIKTVIYFAIIYGVVILFNTFILNRCKLIDLLYGSRKSEKIKLKNILISIIIFIMSAAILAFSYVNVIDRVYEMQFKEVCLYIFTGCVGTFLFFYSLSGLLFRIVSSFKKIYYKGLNSFVFRQISSRINTNVFSMTIICLLLFVTICVLASGFTIRYSLNNTLRELAPIDLNLSKKMGESVTAENGFNEQQIANRNQTIFETANNLGYDLKSDLSDFIVGHIYNYPELTCEQTFGNVIDDLKEQYPFADFSAMEDIMKLSDYNSIAQMYGNKTYDLAENEYMIVADFDSMVSLRNIALESNQEINISEETLKPKYSECQEGFVEMASNHINAGIIIVPDDVIDEKYAVEELVAGNYNSDDKEEKEKIEERVMSLDVKSDELVPISTNTKIQIKNNAVGLGAIVAFVGLYIGIIFLMSGAAILALKELSESADNLGRFKVLKKLGADDKLIKGSIFKQTLLFFIVPLLLAVVHSIFGMIFSCKVFDMLIGTEYVVQSLCMTALILVVIYGGYFVLTYISCKNMIKE